MRYTNYDIRIHPGICCIGEIMPKIYIGWDRKNVLAYEVCAESIMQHAKCDLELIPLQEWKLRKDKLYWRSYIIDTDGQMVDRADNSRFSTEFAFSRFIVPALNEYKDEWVLFIDSDMLFLGDVSELFALANDKYSVMCVQHHHVPFEDTKMYGLKQTYYKRKNWSSVMLMNTRQCKDLSLYAVNNWSGEALHAMKWVPDEQIGALPQEWNYLVGYTNPKLVDRPKIVHYTLGTPDMPGCEKSEYHEQWWKIANLVMVRGVDTITYNYYP